jgi:tagatose 1,6-diphosphate aldolase GatY/KbaY
MYAAMVRCAAERASVPVALHMDHGDSIQQACDAATEGYTSVMVDGSHLPFEKNVALMRQAAEMLRRLPVSASAHVPLEGELGMISGKEDDLETECAGYTDPEEAAAFVESTGVDYLAVSIGTAHGIYKREPKLDITRLAKIRKRVLIPLVLHGATGLSDDAVTACIRNGICKINFATELRAAYTHAVRGVLSADGRIIDVKIYGREGRGAVLAAVKKKITLSGSAGKAL